MNVTWDVMKDRFDRNGPELQRSLGKYRNKAYILCAFMVHLKISSPIKSRVALNNL